MEEKRSTSNLLHSPKEIKEINVKDMASNLWLSNAMQKA
jgi:hypothetical protein